MAVTISTASRNAACTALAGLADAGSGPGVIEIRSGSRPASANDAASGTLLATITCADPAFDTVANGTVALASVPRAATGAADGAASWARLKDSSGATVLDCSVTATGGGGDITLNTTTISTGVAFALESFTVTMPSGT